MQAHNLLAVVFAVSSAGLCQSPATLRVEGISGTSDTLSTVDLAKLRQQTITTNDHGTPVTFRGVLLADVLASVRAPTGEDFHSTAASYYLVAQGRDDYRAIFAWAELDPSFIDKAVYVITERDGKQLSEKDGPFEIIVPGEKRVGRWVRQLSLLRVEPLPSSPAYDSEQTRWIAANLPELESIKVGMTRRDLLKIFTEEGGISTRTWRQYVYRRCAYVKVSVEFAPVGDPSIHEENPDDRITKISQPFLQLSIMD